MNKFEFELAGVTGKARDGSEIQETLKDLFEDALESGNFSSERDVRFEEYDDEGAKALAVLVDDKEIGSIKGEDAEEVAKLTEKNKDCVVSFGVNGHDIEEYEKIIDRYKDKKFWKEEDPNFNDAEVNKAYNDLMDGLKEGSVYQATVKFPSQASAAAEAAEIANMSEEERKQQENMDSFVKYFKILMPLSVLLIIIGILYMIKLSTIMGILNLFFGALGLYFSYKYTKPAREKKKQQKRQ